MYWLLSPLAWLLLAGLFLVWASYRRRVFAMAIAATLVLVALAAMTPKAANLLSSPLERPYIASDECGTASPTVAVVLGGGINGRPRHPADFGKLNLASRRRVDGAVAWWRAGAGRVLVMQGGSAYRGMPALAELMAAYARMQGVPESAIRVETSSRDTWENAQEAARTSPRLPRRLVLVTSMVHMTRAEEAFRRNGFDVCPLGTDLRRLPSRIPWALVPRTSGLANTEIALHEWIGLAYYRARDGQVETAPRP